MEYKIATDSDKSKFNNFIADFEWGDLLQSWEWGDLKAKSGWKPIRVYAEENGKIIACASLLKRNLPKMNKCIIYAPRGPVFDTTNKELSNFFFDNLRQTAKANNAILLKIDPPVEISDTISEKNISDYGFKALSSDGFGGTQPKCVMQLDLDKSIDDIFASFKEKWRYNIRLATKKGVTVKMDCTKDDLDIFYTLLEETCKRDGFLVRGKKYFEDMWDILVPEGYMKLVLTYYDDKPIAGAIAHTIGNKAWYTYGASSNTHRNVMPNHLMQWNLIKWAHEKGCKWYDFRGVSPKNTNNEEDDRLKGLNRFKEGFSPRFVEYIGEYDLVLSPSFYWLWNVAKPKVMKLIKAKRMSESKAQDI
ncbi:MAG: peptidoglycan bridge formation glycyltransferase FemA/FemB family protein [Armatimonadota bacterium]